VIEEKISSKLIKRFDWLLFGVSILLSLLGVLFIYSATLPSGKAGYFCLKQFSAFGLGILSMFALVFFPYTLFREQRYLLYFFPLGLLLGVLFFGTTVRGARSWYNLGFFYFQPVELAKIFYILLLAGYLDREEKKLAGVRYLFLPSLFTLTYVGLTLLQPDFSSSLVFFPLLLGMLYFAGVDLLPLSNLLFYFFLTLGLILIDCYFFLVKGGSKILYFFGQVFHQSLPGIIFLLSIFVLLALIYWFLFKLKFSIPKRYFLIFYGLILASFFSARVFSSVLKPYQRQRLLAFLNPEIDPLGAGYNVLQSRIAIGSGKFFGKGLFSGTQAKLGFLPERHTDFIFSLLSEESGFFGSFFVLGLYFLLIYRALVIAHDARDRFGSLVASGIATMFAFQCMVNIGMVMGILPATGIPLPFLSYGGSHLVGAFFALGLLHSIHLRRFVH